jgi:hypothetical protein
MSTTVHYSFYLESEPGRAAENLSPSFAVVKRIPDGVNLDFSNTVVSNLGSGLYSFSIDWSFHETLRDDGSRSSIFVKIDTGLEILDQKFLTMRIERQDYLPELVDNIQTTANSLDVSATSLNETAETILRIEEGHWVITNNKLYIYAKTVAENERTIENASHIFALYNSAGEVTSQDIYQRINIDPER